MGNVDVERDDKVLTVTLNRPEKHNALRRRDIDAIGAALADLGDVRAVLFRGAGGRAFSAGVDVTEFLALDGADDARDFITAVRTMLAAARTAPLTTICAVDGPCIGAAMELALACDLRVVTTRSRFGLPEIQLGLPSVVDASLLSQYVGLGAAKELILTGDLAAATDPRVPKRRCYARSAFIVRCAPAERPPRRAAEPAPGLRSRATGGCLGSRRAGVRAGGRHRSPRPRARLHRAAA